MTRQDFAGLHVAGDPLILFNIWDAGSAQAVERSGAKAIATGSHSLAGAQGFADGEAIGFEPLLTTTRQIAEAISVPLTVDFEAGFAEDENLLADNGAALLNAGAIGCNFEDQIFEAEGLRDVEEQCRRIAVLNNAGLFVNARTDTFLDPLKDGEDPNRPDLVEAAIARGQAYAQAGAGSFFIPGLINPKMIEQICEAVECPINVMRRPGLVSNAELADIGVARISYGPLPWYDAMAALEGAAKLALQP